MINGIDDRGQFGEDMASLIKKVDKSGDGEFNFTEFGDMIHSVTVKLLQP